MYSEELITNRPSPSAAVLLRAALDVRAENGDPVADGSPSDGMRLNGYNHWPQCVAKVPRCCSVKGCKMRSCYWCTQCKVYLCMKKGKKCFVQYHTIQFVTFGNF